jgi:hypothetical protein
VKIASWAFEGIKSPVANTGETSVPWDLSHLTNLEYIGRGVFDRGSYNAKKLNLDLNLSGLSKLKVIDDSVFIIKLNLLVLQLFLETNLQN